MRMRGSILIKGKWVGLNNNIEPLEDDAHAHQGFVGRRSEAA
jgi:hypothetical protein